MLGRNLIVALVETQTGVALRSNPCRNPLDHASEKALIQLCVRAQGLLHQPKHDQGRVKPIPWVLFWA